MTSLGELATRWTVRVALALYFFALIIRITARGRLSRLDSARLFWTAGFAVFLVHVACAFHFYHDWSHAKAYDDTARQTAAVTGWNWGGGLYINYVFALVWGVDAAWWWVNSASYENRGRFIEWTIHGFLLFITFNATVVFGTGFIRCAGAIAFALLATTASAAAYSRRAALKNPLEP